MKKMQRTIPFSDLFIGDAEWQTFMDGTGISATLLMTLLQEKYKYQKRIRVSKQIVFLPANQPFRVSQFTPLTEEEEIDYELVVIVQPINGWPITSLLVKQRFAPLVLFTVAAIKIDTTEVESHNLRVILNNVYSLGKDNGYAVFDFLNSFFKHEEMPNNLLYNARRVPRLQEEQVVNIVADLTRADRTRRTLLTLYRELNELLAEKNNDNDTRRRVEAKKQLFYHWIDFVLQKRLNEPEENTNIEATSFLAMPLLNKEDDPIQSNATRSNELFKEMLLYVAFIMNVVFVGDEETVNMTTLSVRTQEDEEEVSVVEIRSHLEHLRFRILNHVDLLNVPPVDTVTSHRLRFDQKDYDLLEQEQIFTYNVISHLLTPLLDNETVLLGPHEAEVFMNGGLSDLPRSIIDKKVIFWVLNRKSTLRKEPFTALIVIHRQENRPCRRTLYMPSIDEVEMTETHSYAHKLLEKAKIECFRRQIDSHYRPAPQDYFYTSWYTTLIVKTLGGQIATEMIVESPDWVSRVAPIIMQYTTSKTLFPAIELLILTVRRNLLSSLFPIPVVVELKNIENPTTTVSDLARLRFSDEFIDDAVLRDMINALPLPAYSLSLDTNYWAIVIAEEQERNQLSVFKNPLIQLIFVPINQIDYHWSLGVIDLATRTVSYYTSICDEDSYFPIFTHLMKTFLAKQTPGVTYRFVELSPEELQPEDSVDCALYALNKLSQLAKHDERQTRDSVGFYLKNQLVRFWRARGMRSFIEDVLLRYVDATEENIWESIRESERRLAFYRQRYLVELANILNAVNLYTDNSIDRLVRTLRDSYAQYDTITLLTNLFNDTLKRRQFLAPNATTVSLIKKLHQEVLRLKETEPLLTRRAFILKYLAHLERLMSEELTENVDTSAFLTAFVNEHFREGVSAESLEKVVSQYIV